MAAAIPLITTFAGAAATGGVAAGLGAIGTLAASGIGGFLTVAGGVLSAMGTLAGDKTFKKVGGLMALGGGLMTSLGIGQAAGDASAGSMEAADQVYQGADTTANTVNQAAKNTAFTAPDATPTLGLQGAGTEMQYPDALEQQRASLFDQGMSRKPMESASLVERSDAAGPLGGSPAGPGMRAQTGNPIESAARRLTLPDVQAATAKAGRDAQSVMRNLGDWISKNKEVAQIGGNLLASMYGPQAEQMDMEKSIIARRLRNLNQPIRLGTTGG